MGVRLRQAVLAARELEPVAGRLRSELGLGEPFSDPGVAYFGLRNAVFALGDTFLEVVSPVKEETSVGRLLDRRGGDCGYMLMFALDDFDAARGRVREAGVREVFEVTLDDIAEVHLHPADMNGAIVSLSKPQPPASWRWGGPDWERRSVPGRVTGATVAVSDPRAVAERWSGVLGAPAADTGVTFERDDAEPGMVEISVAADGVRSPLEIGGVRFVFVDSEED
ncbi:MAG TPA: VOC family protein [Solirubrobacteraceae bacterium]|nr:VOC family protein [Solirubrobacteraceae bacterium]